MAPRKRVRRLGDIALVHVAELVGRRIAELIRRLHGEDLATNVAIVKSNVCDCVPVAMYEDFAVNVLETMSRVLDLVCNEIIDDLTDPFKESPVATIFDQLSTVKEYPGVSRYLTSFLCVHLDKLKNLRNLELRNEYLHLDRGNFDWDKLVENAQRMRTYDLQFIEKLSCPWWFFSKEIVSVHGCFSRLKVLTIYKYSRPTISTIGVTESLKLLSTLREVNLHLGDSDFNGLVEVLLSRNRHLEKLAVDYDPEVFLRSKTIYPALKHLHVRNEVMNSAVLRTVATRFPNLTSLNLDLDDEVEPSTFTAFSHLPSLSVSSGSYMCNDLFCLTLREIGYKIVSLEIVREISRSDLFFIYEHCRSCENLKLKWRTYDDVDPLIVPPFPKLKRLDISCDWYYETEIDGICKHPLDFTEMPSLEYLTYEDFEITPTRIESMLLDSENFPCLTEIVPSWDGSQDMESISRFIKQHNLDVIFTPILM